MLTLNNSITDAMHSASLIKLTEFQTKVAIFFPVRSSIAAFVMLQCRRKTCHFLSYARQEKRSAATYARFDQIVFVYPSLSVSLLLSIFFLFFSSASAIPAAELTYR